MIYPFRNNLPVTGLPPVGFQSASIPGQPVSQAYCDRAPGVSSGRKGLVDNEWLDKKPAALATG